MPGLNSTLQPYIGLSNQGATCYMNSLLQTLFMTPEFCLRLYQWKYDAEKHQSKEDCIPYQLQLLFAKLQLKESSYVETTGLTKSFQWSIRESLQQHDVQEFCRVLFDAVEESVKGTDQAKMITELYEGTILDYVRCSQCGNESKKEDKFLDLSLTVKNEFDQVYNDSVEKAFNSYLKPEILSGDNKYLCEKCQARTDAVKGLKFMKLPYILVLQLKRFDLDYTTLQRKKLNDKVTFPQILNMNPFMKGEISGEEEIAETESMDIEESEEENLISIAPLDIDDRVLQVKKIAEVENIAYDREKYSQKLDAIAIERHRQMAVEIRAKNREKLVNQYLEQGEDVYELFSIMIHAGSALGGHYYAYIKSFDSQRWFNFNDTQVKEIDEKDIEKVYGGTSSPSWGGHYGANAYLLMYRKVHPANITNASEIQIPDYLLQELKSETEQKLKEQREREEKLMQLQLKVYYLSEEKSIIIRKDATLHDLKRKVMGEFHVEELRDEDTRLRNYNALQDVYLNTYTGKENWTIESLMILNHYTLVLETKEPDEVFVDYNPNQFAVKVYRWNPLLADINYKTFEQKYRNPTRLQIEKSGKLSELMALVQSVFGIPIERQLLYRKSNLKNNFALEEISILQLYSKVLMSLKVVEGTALLLEEKCQDESNWKKEMEKESYKIVLKFNSVNCGKYENEIIMDKRQLLKNLKCYISSTINVPEDLFLMKRGSMNGHELKDMNATLSAAHLSNGSIVHVELGKPSRPEEIQVVLSLAEFSKSDDLDSECFRFFSLQDFKASKNSTTSELKEIICKHTNSLYPSLELVPELIRVREKNMNHLLRVMTENDVLSDFHGIEKITLAIEILTQPEILQNEHMIVMTRIWSPSTWELSLPIELVISRKSRIDELGKQIANTYGLSEKYLQVCLVPYVYAFARVDLINERWIDMDGNTAPISGSPFFINKDGSLLIARNSLEEMREMTQDEKYRFSYKNYGIKSTRTTVAPYKEKAVKITVKKSKNNNSEDK
ncbi:unnamed protein product [Blepharisma stoltei]|uniref:Ubiquitin carboxyl-terminal hydrolase 47 n=1 Tax=Blepharisma stoltei TaxID=1481888 RepID=A0AAU9IQ51_9CILI|nr:unnamed protein product [Blepharisma stoltei]